MRGGKAELLDGPGGLYEDEAPDFVGIYKVARTIVDMGQRHEAQMGTCRTDLISQ